MSQRELTIVNPFMSPVGTEVYVTIQKNNSQSTPPTAILRVYETGEYAAESHLILQDNGELPTNWQEILRVFLDDFVMTFMFLEDGLDYDNIEFV